MFNMQGQTVHGTQYCGYVFHFDSVRSVPAAVAELERLLAELGRAGEANSQDAAVLAQAQAKVAEAVAAAAVPKPEKSTVMKRLREAAELLQDVASLSALGGAVANAANMVWRLF